MDHVGVGGEEPSEPDPTWGSTMNVASCIESIQYDTQPTQVAERILQMQPSPSSSAHVRRRIDAKEQSSPVEEFSSPIKPSQFTEPDSITSQAPSLARVGTWELPNGNERIPAELIIDPNGDDDATRAQVHNIFAQERESKRKRREEQALPSSFPSQGSIQVAETMQRRMPQNSTPPPQLKRPRRGLQEDGRPRRMNVPSPPRIAKEEVVDLSSIASPREIMRDQTHERSRYAISQYVKASTLVPNFLKDEIKRYLDKSVQHSQSQGSSTSDSDTQEDGYLKTKTVWIFELLRMERDGRTTAGAALTSDIDRDCLTFVLHIHPGDQSYHLEYVGRESLFKSRNEARSNPWFDGNGHPFNIIYRPSDSIKFSSSSSNGIRSNETQPSAEQRSQLQSRLSQALEEKDSAIREKKEIEKRLEAMLASYHTSQEDNDFLRRQYGDASTMAADLAKANSVLGDEVEELKRRLSEGIKSVKAFSKSRITTLREQLRVTQMQLELLMQQNRFTNNSIREKASKWDAYQAKEEIRFKEMERRRLEIDSLRAASYQAMQEQDLQRAIDSRKKPHELFLEVDLDKEKESLPELEPVEEDREEDEVAMLKAEAEAATGQTIDISAPRSRRAKSSRSTIATAAASDGHQQSIQDAIQEQSIQQSQLQAVEEAAQILQGELEYQARDHHVQEN